MLTRLFVVLIIVGAVPPLRGQSTNMDGEGTTVFVNVNVIPMDRERVLPNQTVLVQDGRIAALGPSDAVAVPAGAIRIDGTNRYLLPGLVDMHVHLRRSIDLDLLIANGVTSARVMSGSARSLELREQIAGGELLGPNIYTAGPILEGMPPPGFEDVIPTEGKVLIATAAEAAAEVARQKAAGYDFIKVYNNLPAEAYRGLVEAAKTHGLPVIGHVPIKSGLDGTFLAGQRTIEHLTGYATALLPDELEKPGPDYRSRVLAWPYADYSRMAAVAEATRDAGVFNTPTLMIHVYGALQEDVDRFLTQPWAVYVDPLLRRNLENREQMRWLSFSGDDFETSDRAYRVKQALLRAFRDAGAKILAGSDLSPAGFTLHAELRNLVDAGLTPYEAIEAATSNAAEALDKLDLFGTVAVGKRADLILVKANPLEDVAHASRLEGVMVRGKWLPENELERLLSDIRTALPALEVLERGVGLARKGKIPEALASFEEARALDSTWPIPAGYITSLCRYGAVWGYASAIVTACDQAVGLAPENGEARDSRGLARALTGDFAGAISDFEAFVDWTLFDDARAERLDWIEALRAGRSPFTDEVLRMLREEECSRLVPSLIRCG